MTAEYSGEVVVFLIGMRINSIIKVWKWAPVVTAMPLMIREVLSDPSSGCLAANTYVSGRTIMVVQYWQDTEKLVSYAQDGARRHRPAWTRFNRRSANTSAVGIFHETYAVPAGAHETLYRSMPAMGLAAATNSLAPVEKRGVTARERLR